MMHPSVYAEYTPAKHSVSRRFFGAAVLAAGCLTYTHARATSASSGYNCLSPELLKSLDMPVPEHGSGTQMMTVKHPDPAIKETMEVPVKIALNGWTSADFHSHLAKVSWMNPIR